MTIEATNESETALIGSILKNPAQYKVIRDDVSASDILDMGLRACWDAFQVLSERELVIDQVTVGDELDREGKLQDVAYSGFYGRVALSRIREEGRQGNAVSYAANVLDYSAKRKLLAAMSTGAEWSLNGRKSADIQTDMISVISEIKTPGKNIDIHSQTLHDALSGAYDDTDLASQGKISSVQTGYIDLDKLIGGFRAPQFTIIAGRPGQGKTAIVSNIAMNAAIAGKRVAFFTLEMGNKEIAMRFIAMNSGVDTMAQQNGTLSPEQWPLYTNAIDELQDLKVYLCDLPAIKISQMKKQIRAFEAKYGKMDLVIVDYLQLGGVDEDYKIREQEVSAISRGLKGIAKEMNVPVLAAAQMSRAVEARKDARPILSDLRESGALEQDADRVIFLYRPDLYEKDSAKQNVTEIIIAKQRNGPVGSVELIYRAALTKFENAISKKINFNDHTV
jgi:replicative DNA helicase